MMDERARVEQAIKVLKWALNRMDGFQYIIDGNGTVDSSAKTRAFAMAICALEKRIPMRPSVEGDGYDQNGNIIYDTFVCPLCGNRYELDYDRFSYCPVCGQLIDWSDFDGSD